MEPPSYTPPPASSSDLCPSGSALPPSNVSPWPPFHLNLTPVRPELAFVRGYLGAEPAFVQGEVQLKLVSSSVSFRSVSVTFRGLEHSCSSAHHPIELIESTRVLWSASHPHPSTSGPLAPRDQDQVCKPSHPPGDLPFKFPLTPDLPHCIHLSPEDGGGLRYELEASVEFEDALHEQAHGADSLEGCPGTHRICEKLPIHISRFSPHGQHPPPPHPQVPDHQRSRRTDDVFTLSPLEISLPSPTPIHLSLSQTLLRPSEPLALRIRIPPPAPQLLHEKGLKLRCVRAELRRHIRVRGTPTQLPAQFACPTPSDTSSAERSAESPGPSPVSHFAHSSSSSLSSPPTSSLPTPSQVSDKVLTSTLAMSGKSCRFSSSRAVLLRLKLHSSPTLERPNSEQGFESPHLTPSLHQAVERSLKCESITQSTILHDVYFTVRVVIKIVGREGENQDVIVERGIGVVPDWSPTCDTPLTAAVGKAREAAQNHAEVGCELEQGPAPMYLETDYPEQLDSQPSTSNADLCTNEQDVDAIASALLESNQGQVEEFEEDEEEYDGYELFSTLAGQDEPAPPTIDEDESPPPAPDTPPADIELGMAHTLLPPPLLVRPHLGLDGLHEFAPISTNEPPLALLSRACEEYGYSDFRLEAEDSSFQAFPMIFPHSVSSSLAAATFGLHDSNLTQGLGPGGNQVNQQQSLLAVAGSGSDFEAGDPPVGVRPPAYAAGWATDNFMMDDQHAHHSHSLTPPPSLPPLTEHSHHAVLDSLRDHSSGEVSADPVIILHSHQTIHHQSLGSLNSNINSNHAPPPYVAGI